MNAPKLEYFSDSGLIFLLIVDCQPRVNQCRNEILILILPTSPSSQHSSQYLTTGIFYEF